MPESHLKRVGSTAALVDAQDVTASLLLTRLNGADGQDQMPLDAEPLSPALLTKIEAWLAVGAEWPAGIGAEVESRKGHWAYQQPQRPRPLPRGEADWSERPLDGWILEKMSEGGLAPSPPAPRGKLLRRLYLDLIGIPPSSEELDRFLADDRPDAIEREVDRLLASPHYGQRWARLWLDAARYADSNGYQADQYREVWPYRDWVVQSMNDDKPFDQFSIQQLAGDLLPEAGLEDRIATGFHRLTTCNVEAGVDPEENRVNQVLDRVNTTATVWLGTTLECCQCHSHKYDPFNQREYYELFAYFNNTPLEVRDSGNNIQFEFIGPKMELPVPAEVQTLRDQLTVRAEQFRTSSQQRRTELLTEYATRLKPPRELSPSRPSRTRPTKQSRLHPGSADRCAEQQRLAAGITPEVATREIPAELKPLLSRDFSKLNAAQQKKVEAFLESGHGDYQTLRAALNAADAELTDLEPDTTLVMVEQPSPRETRVFKRGNFLSPGEVVSPATPRVLHPRSSELPDNRLGLAHWIMDPANPLTARVTVNRWWGELLGHPLVATTEDFGTQGEQPTHPRVLDWLALEFVRADWSMKAVHRRMVLTATYQQDSTLTDQHLELDPGNHLLARGARYRLPAETIRDNALTIANVLTERVGGPPVYPPQPPKVWRHVGRNAPVYETSEGGDRYRRGLYVFWRRSAPYPSFVNFDAPDRASCTVKRPRTNTPLQALTLMNDPAYLELAGQLAARMLQPAELSSEARVANGFRSCTAREPAAGELQVLMELLEEQRKFYATHPKQAQSLAATRRSDGESEAEFAAWTYLASTLLNLDETICRD